MTGEDEMAPTDTARGSSAVADTRSGPEPESGAMPCRSPGVPDGPAPHYSNGPMAYLKNLADELDARGLVARVLRTPSGVAYVRVVNPLATTMRESVTCAPSPAGLHDWYFWWSWGECMHRVDDPAGAASKVAHVLESAGAPAG
ncbi:MAG: hypothetical protein ACM3ML_10960 [Micromonosporaceae bacterium]